GPMWLAPTEEQHAVQQEARRFLAAELSRERRLAWDRTEEGYDPEFWRAVAGLGWLGYGLPAAYGGQGASLLDLGLLVEELGRAGRGVSAVLVPAEAPGVTVTPQRTFGKDRQSIVRFREVALGADALAGPAGRAWPRFGALRQRLAALLCADMVGGSDAVLEMTTRYVCEREQFGVKLGTFQAVQQMVAVMAIDLEG